MADQGKDLTRPTLGEQLWLWRKRRGLSQRAAIRRVSSITRRAWQLYEAGRETASLPTKLFLEVNVIAPTTTEALRLARRRSGTSIGLLMTRLGVSKVTLLTWERDADWRLVNYWRDRGYKFSSNRAVQAA